MHWYMIFLLFEEGICLTRNVCIWSKLVILLSYQQWAGKAINCIFLIIFIPNRLIILYLIFQLFALRFTQVFYYILGWKLILITWTWHYVVPWLLFLTMLCSVTNVIKWTWSKYLHPRYKDFVCVNFFHGIYAIYPRNISVIFFAMHEKFALIIIFV